MELFRALNIELTDEKISICKLKFMERLTLNETTKLLYDELQALNVPNSFPKQIDELIAKIGNPKHWRGEEFKTSEKCLVMVNALKEFGKIESESNKASVTARKIFDVKPKGLITTLLEYLLHSKYTNSRT